MVYERNTGMGLTSTIDPDTDGKGISTGILTVEPLLFPSSVEKPAAPNCNVGTARFVGNIKYMCRLDSDIGVQIVPTLSSTDSILNTMSMRYSAKKELMNRRFSQSNAAPAIFIFEPNMVYGWLLTMMLTYMYMSFRKLCRGLKRLQSAFFLRKATLNYRAINVYRADPIQALNLSPDQATAEAQFYLEIESQLPVIYIDYIRNFFLTHFAELEKASVRHIVENEITAREVAIDKHQRELKAREVSKLKKARKFAKLKNVKEFTCANEEYRSKFTELLEAGKNRVDNYCQGEFAELMIVEYPREFAELKKHFELKEARESTVEECLKELIKAREIAMDECQREFELQLVKLRNECLQEMINPNECSRELQLADLSNECLQELIKQFTKLENLNECLRELQLAKLSTECLQEMINPNECSRELQLAKLSNECLQELKIQFAKLENANERLRELKKRFSKLKTATNQYLQEFAKLEIANDKVITLLPQYSCTSDSEEGWLADFSSEESEEEEIRSKILRTRNTVVRHRVTTTYFVVRPGLCKQMVEETRLSGKLDVRNLKSGYSPSDESDCDHIVSKTHKKPNFLTKARSLQRTCAKQRLNVGSESDSCNS